MQDRQASWEREQALEWHEERGWEKRCLGVEGDCNEKEWENRGTEDLDGERRAELHIFLLVEAVGL